MQKCDCYYKFVLLLRLSDTFFLEEYKKHMFKDKNQHVSCDKIPLIFNLIKIEDGDRYLTLKKKSVHCKYILLVLFVVHRIII